MYRSVGMYGDLGALSTLHFGGISCFPVQYFHLTLKNSYNLINLWPYPHQILRPSGATEKVERKGLTVVFVAIQSKGLILSELVKKSELTLHKQLESRTVCNSRLLPRIKISIVLMFFILSAHCHILTKFTT